MKKLILIGCSILMFVTTIAVEACTLREGDDVPTLVVPLTFFPGRRLYGYHVDLLQLVLDKTEKQFGPCHLTVLETYQPINRIHLNIGGGRRFDIVDSTVNPKRDEQLQPIRFPIYRGLMGYRVMVIREGDQQRFDHIRKVKDLRSITIGAGFNWFDLQLVEEQKVPTVTAVDLETLYRMLPAGRFDAILRGSQEILIDKVRLNPKGHQVEEKLVLAYPLPVNYYVKKNNTALAARVRTGLEAAFKDGSFQTFFDSHKLIRETMELVKLKDRHFMYLCNPTLPENVPLENPEYWFKAWPEDIISCSSH